MTSYTEESAGSMDIKCISKYALPPRTMLSYSKFNELLEKIYINLIVFYWIW